MGRTSHTLATVAVAREEQQPTARPRVLLGPLVRGGDLPPFGGPLRCTLHAETLVPSPSSSSPPPPPPPPPPPRSPLAALAARSVAVAAVAVAPTCLHKKAGGGY